MTHPSFGAWLLEQLKERSWSQADLSRQSGISAGQITRVLSGERGVGEDTLTAIARAFKYPPEIVFRAAGLLPPKPDSDPWAEQMDYKISQLKNPAHRRMAERLINQMLEDEEAELAPRRKQKTKPAAP